MLPRMSRAMQTAMRLAFGVSLPVACATASSEVVARDPAAAGSASAPSATASASASPGPSVSASTSASTSASIVPPKAIPIYGSNQIVILVIVDHAVGSAAIEASSQPVVDAVVQTMKGNPSFYLRVVGHAEASEGKDAAARLALAKKRAEAVVAALVAGGVAATRLRADADAATPPAAKTKEARAKQRATTFVVTDAAFAPLN